MPFNRRPSYSLTLAILAALPAFLNTQQVQAQTNTPESEALWSCSMVKGGEWSCVEGGPIPAPADVQTLPEAVSDTETQPSAPQVDEQQAAPTAEQAPSQPATESEAVAVEPVRSAPPAPATVLPAAPLESQKSAPGKPDTAPASDNTAPAAAVRNGAISGAWQCETDAQGQWRCGPGQQQAAPAVLAQEPAQATPTVQPATAPQPRPAAAATTVATTNNGRISGLWECQDDGRGNWQCAQGRNPQPAAIAHADTQPAEPGSNASISAAAPAPYDWYPVSVASGGACHGQYIEPDYQQDATDNEMRVDADRSETQLGGLTVMQGNVQLRQQGRYIRGDQAQIDQVSNQIRLDGNVRYRESGLLLTGDSAQTNATSGETLVSNANYVLHKQALRGSADQLIRLEDDRVRLEQSTFTQCPPGDNSWHVASAEMELDPNKGFGTAKNATLQIADTPVFYFPYMTFPIDDRRLSGFLIPSFGYSDSDGVELTAPYYFNLAPNYDDTLTPRYFSKRGLLLENEFRHLNSYGSQTLNTGILANDNETGNDRWLASIKHNGGIGRWGTTLDYNAVSDDDYFDDLGSSLSVSRQDHLDRLASTGYRGDGWDAALTVHTYQTIDADSNSPYQRLPQLRINGLENVTTQRGDLEFSYLLDATQFERDLDNLTGINRVTGSRLHLQPSVSLPMQWPWGHLTPRVSYWQSQYNLTNQVAGQDDSINRSVGVFSVDSGLVFERVTDSYTQTLEPRAFALYVPETDQQGIPDFDTAATSFSYAGLFRENRFTGLDKIGDAQQLSLGLSSGFYKNNGGELARLSFGQAYYFSDRTVQLNGTTTTDTAEQSNYAAEALWNPHSHVQVSVDTELSRTNLERVESNFKVSYKPSPNKVISLNYRQRNEEREQADLSFIWPVNPTWSVMGRWQRDLFNKQTPESLLGLEYQSCCWRFRVAARRWIEDDSNQTTDSAIYLQFILKGLGTLGTGGEALQDIIGFRERENYHDK